LCKEITKLFPHRARFPESAQSRSDSVKGASHGEMLPYYGPAAEIVLSVKPGATSLAKLVGRDNLTFRATLDLDVAYVRTRSLALDLRILLSTIALVPTGKSAGL